MPIPAAGRKPMSRTNAIVTLLLVPIALNMLIQVVCTGFASRLLGWAQCELLENSEVRQVTFLIKRCRSGSTSRFCKAEMSTCRSCVAHLAFPPDEIYVFAEVSSLCYDLKGMWRLA